jgi:ATP-dependent DNA ligase
MNETTLYQISASTGKGKVWKIRVEDKGTQSEIVIRSGAFNFETLEEGKLITNTAIVSVGKNIGKANETTHYTQAVSEAQAKVELKIREGYTDDVEKAKGSSSAVLGSGIPKPMLAQRFSPTGAQANSKTLTQLKLEGKTVITQFKYDGNRCLARIKNDGGKITTTLFTRKGDEMPVQLSHIVTDMSVAAAYYGLKNGSELILDGELYCDPTVMSFNTLNGLIKRQTASLEQEEQRKLIKYHVYDVIIDKGYEERAKIIAKFGAPNVEVVESKEIIATNENLQKELDNSLSRGYEGLMIRVLGKAYENKRSWQLIKFKEFSDDEFILEDIEKDVRGDWIGAFVLRLPEPVIDANGKTVTTFKAGVSGFTQEEGIDIIKNKHKYIGNKATVEFFGMSEYKIPRFGKVKQLNRGDV